MFKAAKPSKPSPDYPLFAHASGKWAKKIQGKMHYFGRWDDPARALAEYKRFLAGEFDTLSKFSPAGALTLGDACDQFLAAKDAATDQRKLSPKTFYELKATSKRLVELLGHTTPVTTIGPSDFAEFQKTRSQKVGTVNLGNEVTRVRSIFNWLKGNDLIAAVPNFGPEFRKPSAKVLRRCRREAGKKLFTANQIRTLLDESGIHFRAMIMLGINCGFGNTDCATVPITAFDLDGGWLEYPRPKTEVDRQVPLWPETVDSLRASLARRPKSSLSADGRMFVRQCGSPWELSTGEVSKHFAMVRVSASLRKGGFYWLRHTFETVAGAAKDQVAVNFIMGHVDPSMAAVYREEIGDDRILAVTEHVRRWLFG